MFVMQRFFTREKECGTEDISDETVIILVIQR